MNRAKHLELIDIGLEREAQEKGPCKWVAQKISQRERQLTTLLVLNGV